MFIRTVEHDSSLDQFRAEVRAFCERELPESVKRKQAAGQHLERGEYDLWLKRLGSKGWLTGKWPKEHGGLGWGPAQSLAFLEELGRAGAPPIIPFGTTMAGPVIYTFGTEAQKRQHLPGIMRNDVWWCQGYSEPGAGSDLAGLKTRAVRDGDHYVVNGQKIWTSQAHWADWIFCLVRTDQKAKKQEGISFLLIDMRTPGITVRPIIAITKGHHLNEVFFDDVHVPVANLIGEENKGWTYAKFLLGNERALIAQVAASTRLAGRIKEVARLEADGAGGRLIDDPSFRMKLADVEVELEGLRITNERVLYEARSGTAGNGGAILKSKGTYISQALSEIMMEAVHHYGSPWIMAALDAGSNEPPVGPDYAKGATPLYMRQRANTIEGGTEEIQKNVIAKQVLGL